MPTTMAATSQLKDEDRLILNTIQEDFAAFVQAMEPTWDIPDFHYDLANALSSGSDCLVSMPPDHAKSTYASCLFVAWWWGKNPEKNIILAVGTPRLVTVFGVKIRRIMENPVYRAAFPIKIRRDSDGATMRTSTAGGILLVVSRGQNIGGLRANLLLFDDLIGSYEDAQSEVTRESAWDYLVNDLFPRAAGRAQRIGIGTRWHEDDPLCRLEGHEEFKYFRNVKFKAIDYDVNPPKVLWPERHDMEDLMRRKRLMGSRNFDAMYQQEAVSAEGNKIKVKNLRYYKELPKFFNEVIQSWDLTFDDTEGAANTVGAVYARHNTRIYLLHQVAERMDIIAQLRAIALMTDNYPAALRKLIEKKANGAATITLLEKKIMGIIPVTPSKSKEDRVSAVMPLYEAGNVWYPHPSIAGFDVEAHVKEMISFPAGKRNDRVDTESMALSHFSLGMESFSRFEALAAM